HIKDDFSNDQTLSEGRCVDVTIIAINKGRIKEITETANHCPQMTYDQEKLEEKPPRGDPMETRIPFISFTTVASQVKVGQRFKSSIIWRSLRASGSRLEQFSERLPKSDFRSGANLS